VAACGGGYCADEPKRRPNFGRSSCSFWTISFPRFSTSRCSATSPSSMSFRGIETCRKPCRSPRKLEVSLFASRGVRRARKVSAALAKRVLSCQRAGSYEAAAVASMLSEYYLWLQNHGLSRNQAAALRIDGNTGGSRYNNSWLGATGMDYA
jgi:hypothetical protein